jgi:hypothetical protein
MLALLVFASKGDRENVKRLNAEQGSVLTTLRLHVSLCKPIDKTYQQNWPVPLMRTLADAG